MPAVRDASQRIGPRDPVELGVALTEFVLLGVLANRVPGKLLTWNAAALKLEGSPEASALLKRTYRKGWQVEGL